MGKEHQLIRRMLLGTKSGVVAWKNTALEATFQTVIGGVVIRISSDDPRDVQASVKLCLYRDEDLIATWPPFLNERPQESRLAMLELFCEARRKVFRVDQVLDELLIALDSS